MLQPLRAFGLALLSLFLLIACTQAAPNPPPAASQPPPAASPAPTSAAAKPAPPASNGQPAQAAGPTEQARESSDRGRNATATPEPPATPEIKEHNTPTPIAQVAPDISLRPVVEGVLVPMAMTFAPDGRMFFNEVSKGTVRILGGGRK